MGLTPTSGKEYIYLVIGVLAPFLGRALGGKISQIFFDSLCKATVDKTYDGFQASLIQGTTDGSSGVTMTAVQVKRFNWLQARKRLGLTNAAAILVATIRLCVWHWLQPLLYWFAFYSYSYQLDQLQLIFGMIVGVREVIYFLLTIVCAIVNPIYLLMDTTATYNERKLDLLLYIFAPEKYIFLSLGLKRNSYFILLILILFDLFGVAALLTAIISNITPIPMICGYAITTIGGILYLSVVLSWEICKTSKEEKQRRFLNGTLNQQTLDLSSCKIDHGIYDIVKALETDESLTELDLSNNLIDAEGANSIAEIIGKRNKTLQILKLEHNKHFGIEGNVKLALALQTNVGLVDLRIDWSIIPFKILAKTLSFGHVAYQPKFLNFSKIELKDGDIKLLSAALNNNHSVLKLSLEENCVTDVGAFALSAMLISNTTLKELNLYFNQIGDLGCSAFGEALKTPGLKLEVLNLNMNNITDEGLIKLANGLEVNKSITELNLSGNNIVNNGAICLANCLKHQNATVQRLSLLTQLNQKAIDSLRDAQASRGSSITMALPNHATRLLTKKAKEKRTNKRKGLRGSIVSTFTPDLNIQGEFKKMRNIFSNIRFNSVDVENEDEDEEISSLQNNNKNYGTTD
eukprot:g5657.t1